MNKGTQFSLRVFKYHLEIIVQNSELIQGIYFKVQLDPTHCIQLQNDFEGIKTFKFQLSNQMVKFLNKCSKKGST